jgi:small subunit ribosomal protein S6e
MVAFKLVIGMKDGKTVQKEIPEDQAVSFIGKKIGDKFNGDIVGIEGYEFQITGGSDISGTPMRKDLDGPAKRKILCVSGVGVKGSVDKGVRIRKSVAGNTISQSISQVNVKIIKEGKAPLVAPKEEGKTEEAAK